ncbi:MAG TPA: sigma-54 dependent transcriptional regulator, partial [Bacteroidota bacterium]
VPVNCGALPETLLESELFGHEKGAFTGAQYRRKGRLEMANEGTLFLDEVSTISMKTQVDLLRAIESKQFARLGGNEVIQVDFRIICATNTNLEQEVESGRFREDLYYRLNVFSIFVPPLRERRSDIPLLADYFLKKYSLAMNKNIASISPEAMDVLVRYDWKGNVRELENAVERAMVVGSPPCIRAEDLPLQLTAAGNRPSKESLSEVEKFHIAAVLERTGWNITHAAGLLEIDRVTLYNKIAKYGLRK